jgi:hypothetical protein
MTDDDDALMTRDAAMAFLNVSERTLDRLITNREIDVVRINGRGKRPGAVRITRRALLDYLHRNTTRASANTSPRDRGTA